MTSTQRRWIAHSVCFMALLIATLLAFQHTLEAMVRVWIVSPTFSHCFLIIPIAVWLVWQRRSQFRDMAPISDPWFVLGLIPLLFVALVGNLVAINELQQFALIGIVQVLAAAFFGRALYRAFLFPMLFLFFLVPTGEYLIQPLQNFTSWFIAAGLDLLGIPNYREGTIIELANGRFQVEEACAGLRFLIATITLGTLFSALMFRRRFKIAMFVIACCVVPVIGNGLRALGIVLLAHISDNRIATHADHLVYGWGFSVAILVLLLFVGSRFRDEEPTIVAARPDAAKPSAHRLGLAATVAGAAFLIVGSQAFLWWDEAQAVVLRAPQSLSTVKIDGWSAEAKAEWLPSFDLPDQELVLQSEGGSAVQQAPVGLVVYYYGSLHKGHELIESTNRLWREDTSHVVGQGSTSATLGTAPVNFDETVVSSANGRRLIWSCYWIDGRFTTNGLLVKLLQLQAAFTGHHGAALIAISTRIEEGVASAHDRLSSATATLGQLSEELNAAAHKSPAGNGLI